MRTRFRVSFTVQSHWNDSINKKLRNYKSLQTLNITRVQWMDPNWIPSIKTVKCSENTGTLSEYPIWLKRVWNAGETFSFFSENGTFESRTIIYRNMNFCCCFFSIFVRNWPLTDPLCLRCENIRSLQKTIHFPYSRFLTFYTILCKIPVISMWIVR